MAFDKLKEQNMSARPRLTAAPAPSMSAPPLAPSRPGIAERAGGMMANKAINTGTTMAMDAIKAPLMGALGSGAAAAAPAAVAAPLAGAATAAAAPAAATGLAALAPAAMAGPLAPLAVGGMIVSKLMGGK